ncbi:hypothetical protein JCM19236_5861 [Vibrio sp. JCM 19236]|nr:hypothetical protein JCM19236_5861 [Vibrio sp. JCM 19236]
MSLAVASVSSFAAPLTWTDAPTDGAVDSTTAGIEWVSELPTVMPGKWITFTGAGGAPLKAGAFTIEADGSFATDQTVALEVHYYDETTAEVGDLINLTDAVDGAAVKITKVDYTIGDVMFESEKGADVSGVKAIIKQGEDLPLLR